MKPNWQGSLTASVSQQEKTFITHPCGKTSSISSTRKWGSCCTGGTRGAKKASRLWRGRYKHKKGELRKAESWKRGRENSYLQKKRLRPYNAWWITTKVSINFNILGLIVSFCINAAFGNDVRSNWKPGIPRMCCSNLISGQSSQLAAQAVLRVLKRGRKLYICNFPPLNNFIQNKYQTVPRHTRNNPHKLTQHSTPIV